MIKTKRQKPETKLGVLEKTKNKKYFYKNLKQKNIFKL